MSTQEKLLTLLLAHPTEYLSGEQLGQELGISRTAIWKAIQALKAAGYHLDTKAHQGYRYQPTDLLSAPVIRQNLATNLTDLPLNIYEQLASTNQTAKKAAAENAVTPQVFIANQQTAGYGRYGRTFVSPEQSGIYLSLLLQPTKPLTDVGLLTTAVATAVFRAIKETTGISVDIKWVNDLYYQGKKICGILSEAITDFESQQISHVVIGIGLNFATAATIPAELQTKVGALFQKQPSITRNQLISALLNQFFSLYQTYTDGTFLTEYRAHSLLIDRTVTLQQGQATITGKVKTINDAGELVLTTSTGQQTFSSGEVTKVHF
ncbi:biotin--[acetyl-CoA-carboxylase] ligase [Loigolactobacillus jiayinensis]|uniref:Bifunctional ligase/repressor BirA n=1 Tax=Loigolactobacillus jiayinensis TaxID=2486016 RepID=A0ABW1RD36_9LACO|nr:biotin--[acetyl-CoA-carboxylase] ligase [Loigolactobacillus jiayinensis]